MILGTGTDIIEVVRVAEKIQRQEAFRDFVFSPAEIEYCERMANRFEHYAARFAAKEAFLKALKTGWVSGTAFNEIQTLHDENGAPVMGFLGNTLESLEKIQPYIVHVSLSHIKEFALAFVTIERR